MSKQLYIVGIDDSEWSYRAAERAINLSKDTGAKVKLIYVLQWPMVTPITVGGIEPFVFDREDEEKRILETVMDPLLAKYSEYDIALESKLILGEPVHELSKQVKDEHANMLFIGRRGRSTFVDMVLGSVANKLAHIVGIPVVLVP
ncbi:universal stress protein [Thalassotalea sp. 42_200_T64]|nr:universal stress protein [Thalassotalea sp. 42_200_T64]